MALFRATYLYSAGRQGLFSLVAKRSLLIMFIFFHSCHYKKRMPTYFINKKKANTITRSHTFCGKELDGYLWFSLCIIFHIWNISMNKSLVESSLPITTCSPSSWFYNNPHLELSNKVGSSFDKNSLSYNIQTLIDPSCFIIFMIQAVQQLCPWTWRTYSYHMISNFNAEI